MLCFNALAPFLINAGSPIFIGRVKRESVLIVAAIAPVPVIPAGCERIRRKPVGNHRLCILRRRFYNIAHRKAAGNRPISVFINIAGKKLNVFLNCNCARICLPFAVPAYPVLCKPCGFGHSRNGYFHGVGHFLCV